MAEIAEKTEVKVKWEVFIDRSYFDMWAVRPVGDKDFNSPRLFHFTFKYQADQFKTLAEKAHIAI